MRRFWVRVPWIAAAVWLALSSTASAAPQAAPAARETVLNRDALGVPTWVSGELGTLPAGEHGKAAEAFAARHAARALGAAGSETFRATKVRIDEEGRLHVRLQESIAGLPVVGGDLVLHADPKSGRVTAINGTFSRDERLPRVPRLGGEQAIEKASYEALIEHGEALEPPALTYVRGDDERTYLAWTAAIHYLTRDGAEQIDRLFADAGSGRLVALHPLTHDAKNRRVYNANGTTALPGTLVISEGGSTTDPVAAAAYNNLGTTWSFYYYRLFRDSFDSVGGQQKATVRWGVTAQERNNAYWDKTRKQIVCGLGDGVTFGPLCNGLDVVAHEFTHGVTQYESGLVYNNEPGALDESFSDMAGATTEWYGDGFVASADTWKIGEDVYTPSYPGDALRYLNDPAADGYSRDFYPDRYPYTSNPNQTNDYGGVHSNSGIPNLVFYLLAQGGSHPRGKTTVNVSSLGIEAANLVAYRVNRDYLTTGSRFLDARNAMLSFASGYWGASSSQVTSITNAWCAVGLPGCLSTSLTTSPYPSTCSESVITSTANNTFAGSCSGTCTYDWSYSYSDPYYGPSPWYSLANSPTAYVGMASGWEYVQLQANVTCNTNCGTLTASDYDIIWGPASFFCGGGGLF